MTFPQVPSLPPEALGAGPFVPELDRILSLPRRSPLNCDRDKKRRWAPEAQALVEVMTEKFSRGPRVSCACRERHIVGQPNGRILVFQKSGIAEAPPAPPIELDVNAFCRDNIYDPDANKRVAALRPGETLILPGLGHPVCLTELNPVQAWLLYEFPRVEGIFGMISTGAGKTIAAFLGPLTIPRLAGKTVVLLAKPDQRFHYRDAYLRLREHFRVPSIVFDRPDVTVPYNIVQGTPVLRFVPYSLLSDPRSSAFLESLDPEMMLADEMHCLSAKTSSRTMRWLRFMVKRNNEGRPVIFGGWSGSPFNKSMKDATHLAMFALGMKSPYPIKDDDVMAYAAVIDPSPVPDTNSSIALSLRKAFGKPRRASGASSAAAMLLLDNSDIREGFRERVVTTPGVISTRTSSVTASITITEHVAPKMPAVVREALANARLGTRPDGEELVEAADITLCARVVGSGFHFYWAYVNGEPVELIEKWFDARKPWNKELRVKLQRGEVHLDSPKLCEDAAKRAFQVSPYEGDLPLWPADTWCAWEAVKDLVKPEPRVKWIDDFLAQDAADWAKKNRGIVWCDTRAFGERTAKLAGLPWHGGGPNAEAKILAEDGSRSIIASIDAHSEGRDGLQFKFHKMYYPEPPSSSKRWEQTLARLVRPGQPADTVEVEVNLHIEEYREAFRKAIMYAEWQEATTPNQQLLLAADIDFDA